VATPPNTHQRLVGDALSAGKHVLCEKPLSEEIEEVIDLVTKAREHGVILLAGMNFRYLSTSQRIRQVVKDRRLGEMSYGQFTYLRHRDGNRVDLNDYPMKMAYPMLLEQSIHHFDLLRYCYCAEVESLVADSWRPSWSTYDSDCCVSVLFRFENGVRVNYLGTWTASWNKMTFHWRTEFESGVLIQRSQFDDLVRVDFRPKLGLSGRRFKTADESEPAEPEELAPCVPFVDDSRRLLAEWVGAIRGDIDPTTTGHDHLRSLCMVWACIESLKTRRWVELRDFYAKLGIPPGLLETN
jgi:predicted dehydrogenase